jgi:uncharacterized membrane protein HdeD (DUF308 family)
MTTPAAMSQLPTAFEPVADIGKHWGFVSFFGVITVILGIMVVAWPDATLVVVAVLFAIYLIVNGIFDVFQAIGSDDRSGGIRVLLGVLGALSVFVGLLCLRAPLQTLAVIALLVGAFWMISGVIEIVTAITAPGHHWWRLIGGLLSLVAGVIVLLNPGISLAVLTWFVGIWLIIYGIVAVVGGFALRSAVKEGTLAV